MMSCPERKDINLDWRQKLFLNETFSDCAIWVKTPKSYVRFPCHKIILSLAGDVFVGILQSLFEENGNIIIMEDMNPDAVAKTIEYIYLGHCELKEWNFVSNVLKVASTYEISKLIHQCEEYIIKNITLQNVCCILEAAIFCHSEKLEETCKSLCKEGGFVVLNTSAFQMANTETVKRILSIPDLQVHNEMSVFKAAWKWATYKCCKEFQIISDKNVVDEMNSFMEFIGFQFMSPEELETVPVVALEKFHQMSPDQKTSCLKKGRKMTFPLHLLNYGKTFQLDLNFAHISNGNITLLSFSVNTRVYLENVKYDYRIPNFARTQSASLRVYSQNGTLVSFPVGERTWSMNQCIHDFRASELLAVEAHEEYTIVADPGEEHCDISWPLAALKCQRLGDVEIAVLTGRCYGISQITFIEDS